MVTRRKLILSVATGLLAAALPHSALAADDPAGILTAIYTTWPRARAMAAARL